jgi:histidine triad (HIT) family protein
VTSIPGCVFCRIVAGEVEAASVYEDENTIVFLDKSPLFPGHCLVCPKKHYNTLPDVPPAGLLPLMGVAQLMCRAVEQGLGAEGSFVAVNNKVSQSVPHLHVHVIPRKKRDGMKGFFWPRHPYADNSAMLDTQSKLRSAVTYLRQAMTDNNG